MATRKIVPRADNEGGIGTALKRWASAFIVAITCTTINALTLVAASVGFTIAGGTTSKTLTVLGNATVGGAAVNPTLPAFLAQSSLQSNVTGDGTQYIIQFDTEIFDQAANYAPATGIFTAPITGRYQLSVIVTLTGLAASNSEAFIQFVMSNRTVTLNDFYIGPVQINGGYSMSGSLLVDMDANDTAKINLYVAGGTKIVGIYGTSFFSGFLVC